MTNPSVQEPVRLTQFSHGAGCGCKISPRILDEMLQTTAHTAPDARLLVGNDKKDDAAVYDLGNGTAVISTTDFFMPIVDEAYDFGRIASVNAISDIYAMGGTPLMAIAVLGWPVDKISAAVAREVLEGGRAVCREAGIPLAGGHSIDSPEPIFGLAVTGIVDIEHLKQNSTAEEGCLLFLTKPLGVGILTTAQKKGLVKPEHLALARNSMLQLNRIGEKLGKQSYVKALTDVTGFGLLGHLTEMCEGSGLSAEVEYAKVPVLPVLEDYLRQGSVPGGTRRNWDSYGHKIKLADDSQKNILADPQTSGGLLAAVDPAFEKDFLRLAAGEGLQLQSFGRLTKPGKTLITVH